MKFLLVYFYVVLLEVAQKTVLGLEKYGIKTVALVPGFFGALLAVRKEGKSLQENVIILITGAFSSTFLTPFLLELLKYDTPNALGFFGFIVGSSSIKIVDWVTNKFFKTESKEEE